MTYRRYTFEEIIPLHTPKFAGRSKAQSPEPLGSRRWRPIDSDSRYLPDSRFTESSATGPDIRGLDIPDDDQADFDSGDGTYDISSGDELHDTW